MKSALNTVNLASIVNGYVVNLRADVNKKMEKLNCFVGKNEGTNKLIAILNNQIKSVI